MSASDRLEFWRVMIPIIGITVTNLLVTVLHSWNSARGRQENREQNIRIESGVSEIKGQVETQTQIIKKENGDGDVRDQEAR